MIIVDGNPQREQLLHKAVFLMKGSLIVVLFLVVGYAVRAKVKAGADAFITALDQLPGVI